MNKLKITLSVIVLAAIVTSIFFWIYNLKDPGELKVSENTFTSTIEREIEQLKTKPDNKFCKDFYQEVASHINEWYKPLPPQYPYGRFGQNQSENDQWKENLEKNLYATYSEKFIKQAKTVFSGSKWEPNDLKFIQEENNELKKSELLDKKSNVYKDFTTIQTALDKYNEIGLFILSCKHYDYSETGLSASFPIADMQSKIQRAASLRANNLENGYVNNCTRLHDGLKGITHLLFSKHVGYLDTKIVHWSNMWCNYNSHKDYSQNLNTPIKNEITDLANSTIYGGENVDIQSSRLSVKWSADNQKAYNAIYPCK